MSDEPEGPPDPQPTPPEDPQPTPEPEIQPTPDRFVKVAFTSSGVQIEWSQGLGPVDMLGAAGYIEWHAKMMLTSEMAARQQRAMDVARVIMPPGGPRPDH